MKVFGVQVGLALLVTGIFSILVLLTHSEVKRYEALLNDPQLGLANLISHASVNTELKMKHFLQERNFWLSLTALALWASSWRLKSLFDGGKLEVKCRTTSSSRVTQIISWVLFVVLLCMADIPICRMNYNFQLYSYVTPEKTRLLTYGAEHRCNDARLATATGACADFCKEARDLSEKRLGAIKAREWHMLGRVAAGLFDDVRGVEQGSQRIEKLFAERSCEKVLQSVDKSNIAVNVFCMVLAGIAVVCALVALQSALDTPPAPVVPAAAVPVAAPVAGNQPAHQDKKTS